MTASYATTPPPGCHIVVRIGSVEGGRYPVEVTAIDAAGATHSTRHPGFGPVDRSVIPDIASDGAVTGPQLDAAGSALFNLLAGCGFDEVWSTFGPAALLLDIAPPELRAWPWELLRDRGRVRPFADPEAPATRLRLAEPLALADVSVPTRLLVVVGDPEDEDLRADDEIEAIHEGLRSAPCCWQVDVLRGPRTERLYDDYRHIAPDVLHLIGHGVPSDAGPAVEIIPPGAEPWPLTADFVTGALPRGLRPRLVVLNACRTTAEPGPGAPGSAQLARGLTEALLSGSTPAVIAMQGDVASGPAVRFTQSLYGELAAGQPLHVAVAAARNIVRFTTGFQPRDWVLPVLEMRADPAIVLRQPRQLDPSALIRQHNGFQHVPRLVDRAEQRRQLQRRIDAAGSANAVDGVVLVTGERNMGKTLLIRSCLVTQAVRGLAVVYVSLEGRGHVSAPDFILEILDATARWLGEPARELVHQTRAAVCALLRPEQDGPTPASLLPVDAVLATPPRPGSVDVLVDDAYKRLQGLLVNLARTRPLVLVLDHVGEIDARDAFVRGLVVPATAGELPGVRLVLVDVPVKLEGILGDRAGLLLSGERKVAVPPFARQEAVALVREYLTRSRPATADPQRWAALRTRMVEWAERRSQDPDLRDLGPSELPLAVLLNAMSLGLELEEAAP